MATFLSEHLSILVAAGCAFIVAVAGGIATEIGPWYRGLRQPSWKPPDWAFGPAWTVIFALAAVAAAKSFDAAPTPGARALIVTSFAVNGALNALWSVLYFTRKRPDWALAEVCVLWLSIVELIVVAGYFAPLAGLLLLPYLVWVSFAARLNLATVRLNGPFGPGARMPQP